MINAKIFEQIGAKLSSSAAGISDSPDIKQQHHFVLESLLSQLNLVTREEFDVQQAVLQRTRSKLESLEKQVAELEQALKP